MVEKDKENHSQTSVGSVDNQGKQVNVAGEVHGDQIETQIVVKIFNTEESNSLCHPKKLGYQHQVPENNQSTTQQHIKLFGFEKSPSLTNPPFYGRTDEFNELQEKILDRQCKVLILYGLWGMGKTYLATKLAYNLQDQFDYIIWSSTYPYRPIERFLEQEIFSKFPSPNSSVESDYILGLIQLLNNHKILFIIDGLEQIKERDKLEQVKEENQKYYPKYQKLLEVIAEGTHHQSCLLVTNQKKIKTINSSYKIPDLDTNSVKELLDYRKIKISPERLQQLSTTYGGNPRLLEIISVHVKERSNSDADKFLKKIYD